MKHLLRGIIYRLRSIPLRPRQIDRSLLLVGMFKNLGWHYSVQKGSPVDWQGDPLPWYTYPAIFWIESVLTGQEHVFEYGAGNSTLWYAQRVSRVISVESNLDWYTHLNKKLPGNVELIHIPTEAKGDCEETNDPYVQTILTTEDSSFDIVVIDGQA